MSLDTLGSSSKSPYAHGRKWRRREETGVTAEEYRFSRPLTILNYNLQEPLDPFTSPGSPYHVRKPIIAYERSLQWVEQQQHHQHENEEHWRSSHESELNVCHHHQHPSIPHQNGVNEAICYPQELQQQQHHQQQFPIIINSTRNMHHIRQRLRRDPEHQGTRTIRSTRVINKAGERNVQFINLPQKSVRFVKDLVTTLALWGPDETFSRTETEISDIQTQRVIRKAYFKQKLQQHPIHHQQ
ncbi:uncharacterized protein LOC129773645 [Toxorhynchites rutilus septentrionalis]|uniref:uncharacterized protein LOC129773645 n=1 Tax=Toxorhynchites rutilus septentrionalis TaxID=329112 RepID=UPI002478DF44|nr:uncharacterized protein LOC129773645 [Toxorhynchites rutilus septentrionalis]